MSGTAAVPRYQGTSYRMRSTPGGVPLAAGGAGSGCGRTRRTVR